MNKTSLKVNGHDVYQYKENSTYLFLRIDGLFYPIENGRVNMGNGKTEEQAANFCRAEEIDELINRLKAKTFFLQSGRGVHKKEALKIIESITDILKNWQTSD